MTNSKNKFHAKPILVTKRNILAGLTVVLLLGMSILAAQKKNDLEVLSPDAAISVKIDAGAKLEWSVEANGEQIIAPSAISLSLEDGDVLAIMQGLHHPDGKSQHHHHPRSTT